MVHTREHLLCLLELLVHLVPLMLCPDNHSTHRAIHQGLFLPLPLGHLEPLPLGTTQLLLLQPLSLSHSLGTQPLQVPLNSIPQGQGTRDTLQDTQPMPHPQVSHSLNKDMNSPLPSRGSHQGIKAIQGDPLAYRVNTFLHTSITPLLSQQYDSVEGDRSTS